MFNRIKKYFTPENLSKLTFFGLGIGSTVWFLIKVIPKPSRAAYPCMRAAAPFMSAFVIYLTGLFSTFALIRTTQGRVHMLKISMALIFVGTLLFGFNSSEMSENQFALVSADSFQANAPSGVAKGLFPGRVVWIYNPEATNGNMTNKPGDFWFMDKNCPQGIVDSMLASGIRRMGGKSNLQEAWNVVFSYFNLNHGKGNTGYSPGEKIAVKINLTNSCCTTTGTAAMDASPQLVLSILKQLTEVVKVAQKDIWIGDNYRLFRDEYWNKCHPVYPDVHFIDGTGKNGREQTKPSAAQLLLFSDHKYTSSLPQHYLDAAYLINIPCLKSHDCGGITIAAKNHQGSILQTGVKPENQSAYFMHYCLPKPPDGIQKTDQYRHLVDFMGHKELGGKTLIYIVDGLWAGRNWDGVVEKWQMDPFNNDYPSSLFFSQDPVAIESVCFDFLLKEYENKSAAIRYPYMTGVDDYLRQSADPASWPAGISYDPEGDGTLLGSLGVYEHWNNAVGKQYSRNLKSGTGIELVRYNSLPADTYQGELTAANAPDRLSDFKIYPNPFAGILRIENPSGISRHISIFDQSGKIILHDIIRDSYQWKTDAGNQPISGTVFFIVRISDAKTGEMLFSQKVISQPRSQKY